jgi:hypothetical protein
LCIRGNGNVGRAFYEMLRSGIIIFLMLLCCAGSPAGQNGRITGIVLDGEQGTPLANANVFLANTPYGIGTGMDGSFRVTGIPPGVYTLVVSLVGYEVRTRPVHVVEGDSLHMTFYLEPRPLQAEGIQTVAAAPVEWRKFLKLFEREFIGQTPNADETRLLNPEVINLRRDSIAHLLIASTDSIIRVENNALGYRLSIVLSQFKWNIDGGGGKYLVYARFEPMQGMTGDITAEWEKNRQRSYNGSMAHFLKCLALGTLEQEGFEVHIGNLTALTQGLSHPLTSGEFGLAPLEVLGLWRFTFEGWLRVHYRGTRGRTSYITLNKGVAVLDDRGHLATPLCFEILGDWQEDRVAEMLPLR